MSMIGLLGLLVAFAGCVISVLCLGVAHILYKKRSFERSDTFAWGGRWPRCSRAVALTVCCAVLVWCFFSGDNTIQYVLGQPLHLHGPRGVALQARRSLGGASGLAAVLGVAHCRVQRGARVRHAQECAPAR